MGQLVMVVPGAGAPSQAAVDWDAEQTIRMHTEQLRRDLPARCAQCPDQPAAECPRFEWARVALAIDQPGR